MKDIKKPEFMKEAMQTRGHNVVLELLIAMLVFFVADIAMGILQMPALIVYLLGNREYMSMILSNSVDFNRVMQIMLNLPDWMMVVVLLLEVGLIVVSILYCRIFEKRKAGTLGFCRKGLVLKYLEGIAIGTAIFLLAYVICFLTGSVTCSMESLGSMTIPYIIAFLVGYMIQGMAEEVFCRGYLMVSISRRYRVSFSVVISALFFSMLHGMNAGVGFLAFFNLFLFGVLMGLLFIRYENIWVIGAFHSIWNFLQGNVFGISVSGMAKQPSFFVTDFTEGREWINGGSFGVEGGLGVTLALLVAVAILWNAMSKKGYFVLVEPVASSYDRDPAEMMTYRMSDSMQERQQAETVRENMGVNPQETPWHPQEEAEQKRMTGFDKSYFKD